MVCGECNYCNMAYAKGDWEVFSCTNENGRGCKSWDDESCDKFEKAILTTDEEREKCLNCPKPSCDDCIGGVIDETKPCRKHGWEEWQDTFLLEHQDMKISKLVEILHKKPKTITSRKMKLGICTIHPVRFTQEEDEYILTHTTQECVEHLGKSRKNINSRRFRLKRFGKGVSV